MRWAKVSVRLLQNIDADLKTTAGSLKSNVVEQATSVLRVPLEDIIPNPKNPRKDFDEQSLHELAASFKTLMWFSPLRYRKIGHNKYQLIAGERRFKAAANCRFDRYSRLYKANQ